MSAAKHNSLQGKFLLAEPSMPDSNFSHTLTLMCDHDENHAIGIVINREIPKFLRDQIIEELGLIGENFKDLPIFEGGPCQPERGFVIHTDDWLEDASLKIAANVYLSASKDILRAIAGGYGPKRYLIALGYAGWGAGQLESEILRNSWLVADFDMDLVFDEMDSIKKWSLGMDSIGIDPAKLTSFAGRA